jgi:hypothetical protein
VALETTLFRLGIILLELGFSKPWAVLRGMVRNALPPLKQTDYHVAERLCDRLTREMGAKYPLLIRKCIGCDFGLDEPQNGLSSRDLQARLLVDVVGVLKNMEQAVACLG